jgi:RNA polymerase sigma factor (sigma-70 family)
MPPPPAEGIASRLVLGPALRTQPDRRLVRLVREGYEAAFEEIVRRYGTALIRYAAAIVGSRSEDVTQDALSKALLALRRNDAEIDLRPWLYRIVRNTALNDLRDNPRPPEALAGAIAMGRSAAEEAEQREELTTLIRRLRELPEPQRAAIVMRELEGLSHDEIAATLGLSGGATRQTIYRARQALREGLGMLIPLPLLRHLVGHGEGAAIGAGAGGALAAGGAGGALKAGAVAAVLAGGVGAGIALQDGDAGVAPDGPAPAAEAAIRAAATVPSPRSALAPWKGAAGREPPEPARRSRVPAPSVGGPTDDAESLPPAQAGEPRQEPGEGSGRADGAAGEADGGRAAGDEPAPLAGRRVRPPSGGGSDDISSADSAGPAGRPADRASGDETTEPPPVEEEPPVDARNGSDSASGLGSSRDLRPTR